MTGNELAKQAHTILLEREPTDADADVIAEGCSALEGVEMWRFCKDLVAMCQEQPLPHEAEQAVDTATQKKRLQQLNLALNKRQAFSDAMKRMHETPRPDTKP